MVNNPLGLPLDAWGNPSVTGYQTTFGQAPMQGMGQDAAQNWGKWSGGQPNPFANWAQPQQQQAQVPGQAGMGGAVATLAGLSPGLLGNLLNMPERLRQGGQPQQPQAQPQLGNFIQGPPVVQQMFQQRYGQQGQQFQPATQARPQGQSNNGTRQQDYTPRELPQPAGDPMKRLIDAIAASRANRK